MLLTIVLMLTVCCTAFAENYTVGVCQLMVHDSLDQATQGFVDALTSRMNEAGHTVDIDIQVAGDANLCSTVVNAFNAKRVDLIMGNATPDLLAAANMTTTTPVLSPSLSRLRWVTDMLKIFDLQKTFTAGTVNAKTALDGLELKDGDFVTVIGGNGAGKSTLLNAIAGVWKPDYGTIEIDGVNVTNMPEHERAQFLGRVFQDPMKGTSPDMEIAENLAIASKRGIKRRFVRVVKKQIGKSIVNCWLLWNLDWRTGCPPRWVCCPAASVRLSLC